MAKEDKMKKLRGRLSPEQDVDMKKEFFFLEISSLALQLVLTIPSQCICSVTVSLVHHYATTPPCLFLSIHTDIQAHYASDQSPP